MRLSETAIRQFVADWHEATISHDDEKLLALIADDAIFLTPGHPPMNKKQFADVLPHLKKFLIQIQSDIQEIRIDSTYAFCWNQLHITMKPRESGENLPQVFKRSGPSLSILQIRDDRIVLVRDANLMITE